MSNALLPVRPDNDFDREAFSSALTKNIEGSGQGPLEVYQFAAGASNLTYLIQRGSWSGVLRTPPRGPLEPNAHDMGREGRWLLKLAPAFPLAPRVLWQEASASLIGVPFYVMEYRPGLILDRNFPPEIAPSVSLCQNLSEQFAAGLAALHQIDWKQLNMDEFSYLPEQFVERQVRGWVKRYFLADGEKSAQAQGVAAWLSRYVPQSVEATIIHNDFKFNNIVLDTSPPHAFRAIVDWEMAAIGDPLFDLAVSLTYWMNDEDPPELKTALSAVTAAPGFYSRERMAERYQELSGRDITLLPYYRVLADFKLAVIMQQLYARWARGQTQDTRFQHLGAAIRALINKAWVLAERTGPLRTQRSPHSN